jgi:hypothetical protein
MSVKTANNKTCAQCGAGFHRPPSKAGARFCGMACVLAYRATQLRGKPVPQFLDPLAREKWLVALRTPERRRRMSELLTGRARATDKTRRGSAWHYKALHFTVKSPAGVSYRVDNLSEFVRSHVVLFDPADVVDRSRTRATYACRATVGLRSLRSRVGTRLSWKGWTLAFGCQDELGRVAMNVEEAKRYANN